MSIFSLSLFVFPAIQCIFIRPESNCYLLSSRLSDNARFTGVYFAKFDVDEVGELAAELAIRAMPTFIAFNDGEKAGTLQGANPKALEDLVTKLADL